MFESPINPPDNHSLCIYCDADEVRAEARQLASDRAKEYNIENPAAEEDEMIDEDFYDDCLDEVQNKHGMCRYCYDEDHADDDRDDY
jgi:hypothetical protein